MSLVIEYDFCFSESGIRDDIMSPRTMVNAHTARADPTNARDLQKSRLDE